MKVENEMKEKNEAILNKWRKCGFLRGLKEGSINEWRCAKSFDLMAEYLNDKIDNYTAICTYVFPMIRRMLCRGKNRVYRIIDPDIIIALFNEEDTVGNVFESEKDIKLNSRETEVYNAFKKFINTTGFEDIKEMKVGNFVTEIFNFKNGQNCNQVLKSIFSFIDSYFDIEAFLMLLIAEDFKLYFEVNAADGLKIGDEIVTDQGEHLILTGFKESGEGIFEEKK